MPDLATSILTGVIIAAVSAWITVRLSLQRFRTERWWEKKVQAYERVIEALYHVQEFSDAHLKADMRGTRIEDDEVQELQRRVRQAIAEVKKAADIGGFLLSDEAKQRLKQYLRDSRQASAEADSYVDYLIKNLEVTSSCLDDIIRLAKKDLSAK